MTMPRTALAVLAALLLSPGDLAAQELTGLTAREAATAIRDGRVTSRALVDALIDRAAAKAGLNAFITLDARGAREAADRADAIARAGAPLRPLHGVPIVAKDNINAAGLPATAGTPALKGFVPSEHAPVLKRLLDAGAILLGKTNMHELAFGITSNNAAFGAVGNAYAPDRFAGGSSGGTGAAIGARMAPAGLGTDTGGSVRIPAALNGIAGLRPTSGRYPQAGIAPISHTRDTAGPMARSVSDLVLLDAAITGGSREAAPAALAGQRLGVAKELAADTDPETARLFAAAVAALRQAGAEIVEVEVAAVLELNAKVSFPVALYEVRGDLDGFVKGAATDIRAVASAIASPDVKSVFENLVLGEKAIPENVYRDAVGPHRAELVAAYNKVFNDNRLDALIFPTTPLPAQPIKGSDEKVMLNGKEVPTFQTFIRNTDPGSNAGIPGLSVPMGLTRDGLPVGLELDGPAGSDRKLLAIGLAVEEALGRLPPPP
ncbi:MAG: indoleacetamide hydrolase [Xanthobacteraceae bacterium]|nr:indoleacetamide hydrolase [Xanthobacteraceae bacterium]